MLTAGCGMKTAPHVIPAKAGIRDFVSVLDPDLF